jgi:hypothetical protein
MKKENSIALFNEKQVRRIWDETQEIWYFSIVDVIDVLIDSVNSKSYWKVFKHRLKKEGSEVVTKCNQLKMQASDGKYYATDCFSTEDLLRVIQSLPSPKAELFKLWLAKAGKQGGTIAGNTKKEIEDKTGKKVITSKNAAQLQNKKKFWLPRLDLNQRQSG